MDDLISRKDAIEAIHGRTFKEIVVRYPTYTTYPERKGKPYFSIKYTENGQEFIGYSTYKPEVLSEYLKEDFMPSAQPNLQPTCNQLATDCISRQVAIDSIAKQMPRSYTPDGSHPADEEIFRAQEVFADCIEALEILPSAQPEIIRCKDCDWWTRQEDSVQGRCKLMQMYPAGGWYCGNARRRGGDSR